MTVPPPAGPAGLVQGVLDRVFAFMTVPWKAAVVVLLIILIGVGWALWQERDRLFFQPPPARAGLDLARMPAELTELLHQTGADLDTVWAVDFGHNAQTFVTAQQRGGAAWIPSPRRLPLILDTSDSKGVVTLLHGLGLCGDPASKPSLLLQRFAADGMVRACIVAIRSPRGEALGLIYFGWRHALDKPHEDAALAAARDTAADLVR
jgi:hypothetical protein